MNRPRVFLTALGCSLVASSVMAANSLVYESKSVPAGATGVQVGVYLENDVDIHDLETSFTIRSVTGGAYMAGNFSYAETSRFVSFWDISADLFYPGNDPGPCPFSTPGPLDYVSPDAFRHGATQVFHPNLPPGNDGSPPGGTPSLTLTFDVTMASGTFEIDTSCVSPTYFRDAVGQTLAFTFTKGIITVVESPPLISYQGLLTDGLGDPVADGSHSVTFRIYDLEVGGTDLWSSGVQSISTSNGIYGYLLGSNVPFPADLFTETGERWLAIQVESDPEMSPRTRLVSVPYALHAEHAELAQSLVPNAVSSAEIIDSTIIEQNIDQETWIIPTLLNGWEHAAPPYSPVGYFKDVDGVVHLRGAVRTPTGASLRDLIPVFQLPAGYRPQFQEVLNCGAHSYEISEDTYVFRHYRLDVLGDGTIRFQNLLAEAPLCGTTGFPDCGPVFLNGATFRAAGD